MPPSRESDQNTSTCDRCRVLKVKCYPDEKSGGSQTDDNNDNNIHGSCRRCSKSGHECTYRYSFKKSGRPPGSKNHSKRSESGDIIPRPTSETNHFSPNRQQGSQGAQVAQGTQVAPPQQQQPHQQQYQAVPRPIISPVHSIPLSHSPHQQQPHRQSPHLSTHNHNHASGSFTYPILDTPETSYNLIPPSLHLPPGPDSRDDTGNGHHWGPARDSIFGSARTTLEATDYHSEWMNEMFPSTRRSSFDFTLPSNTNNPSTSNHPSTSSNPFGLGAAAQSRQGFVSHSQNDPHNPPLVSAGPSCSGEASAVAGREAGGGAGSGVMESSGGPARGQQWASGGLDPAKDTTPPYLSALGGHVSPVEFIGTWSEFCFFFSLFMRHQHALVPLMHKPTFAMDVLNRRDQRDEAFRGLLFSIVTYTICQCPINIMSNEFTRERLHELLGKCQHASRIIQLRHISQPNLVIAASTCLDILSSQATNKPDLTAALFSDAQRIVYSLKLNLQQPSEGLSSIDLEISRRVFWQIYNTDKTNVMNGGHMLIPDHEGIPPLPLEVEDDYLSTSGHHPPSHHGDGSGSKSEKLSYMSGYVAVVQIFRILGECQIRHRTLLNDPTASQGGETLMAWLELALERLRRITDGLPGNGTRTSDPKAGDRKGEGPGGARLGVASDADATAGIQQANIVITALCAEFALLDFKVVLKPEEDLMTQREQIAKKAYSTLSSIPIEYLASNGEAMRGKVLRTILALFHASSSPEELGGSVWDWWSMYSQVQFIQVIPAS